MNVPPLFVLAAYTADTWLTSVTYGFTSSSAKWIWTSAYTGSSVDTTVYCRKTLSPDGTHSNSTSV